ncbi:amidase [Sphingomonas oryzagri]
MVTMITLDDYLSHDAVGLAALVARHEVSAAELVAAAIARAQEVEPQLNAIATPLYEAARTRAGRQFSGPFAGVPFAIKDLNHAVAGVPLTHGSRAFASHIPRANGELVDRYLAAGLIPIATTASSEFGLSVTTESALYGATRNPWNRMLSAGGSSGGSAALVAAGVIPAAHATDGGGSIRIPAAACGLFGLKPSRGRTPAGTIRTEGWSGLAAAHVVSRSVRDSAALLDATHGAPFGARIAEPEYGGSFAHAATRDPRPLRIAIQRRPFAGPQPHPDCLRAIDDAAALCVALGHGVEETQPDLPDLTPHLLALLAAHTAATLAARTATLGRPIGDDEIEPITAAYRAHGHAVTGLDLVAAETAFMAAAVTMAEFHRHHDLLLTPVLGRPPAPLGSVSLDATVEDYSAAMAGYSPFTAYQNVTGQPAMSVPLHWSDTDVPIGVQFVARFGEEALLFSLAGQLERTRPWFDRRPALLEVMP